MLSTRSARELSDQFINTGTVHIRIPGPDARYWCLQKSLLRHHSQYFRDVLSPNTLDETINDLETLHPDIVSPVPSFYSSTSTTSAGAAAAPFELFVQWIYTGTIDLTPTLTGTDYAADAQLDVYIRLFCLCAASHFNVPELSSLALTRMYELYHVRRSQEEKNSSSFFFTAAHIQYIYTHTAPLSPLRNIAMRASVYDFWNTTSTSPTVAAGNFAKTSVDDGGCNAKDDRNDREGRKIEDRHRHPRQPSYAFMFQSATFCNDLVHAIRADFVPFVRNAVNNSSTGTTSFKHPFQVHDLKNHSPSPSLSTFYSTTTTSTTTDSSPTTPVLAPSFAAVEPPSFDPKREHGHGHGHGYGHEQGLESELDGQSLISSSLTETPLSLHSTNIRNEDNEAKEEGRNRDRDGEVRLSVPVTGLLTPDITPKKDNATGLLTNDVTPTKTNRTGRLATDVTPTKPNRTGRLATDVTPTKKNGTGLLISDETPTKKKNGKSVRESVQRRSLEEWIHDENASTTAAALAAVVPAAPAPVSSTGIDTTASVDAAGIDAAAATAGSLITADAIADISPIATAAAADDPSTTGAGTVTGTGTVTIEGTRFRETNNNAETAITAVDGIDDNNHNNPENGNLTLAKPNSTPTPTSTPIVRSTSASAPASASTSAPTPPPMPIPEQLKSSTNTSSSTTPPTPTPTPTLTPASASASASTSSSASTVSTVPEEVLTEMFLIGKEKEQEEDVL